MVTMLGISLYSYVYLKLAKMLCFSYYLLCFQFDKIGEKDETGSAQRREEWELAQTMCTHVSKCKKQYNKNKQITSSKRKKIHIKMASMLNFIIKRESTDPNIVCTYE
jgi:hypothetical protein